MTTLHIKTQPYFIVRDQLDPQPVCRSCELHDILIVQRYQSANYIHSEVGCNMIPTSYIHRWGQRHDDPYCLKAYVLGEAAPYTKPTPSDKKAEDEKPDWAKEPSTWTPSPEKVLLYGPGDCYVTFEGSPQGPIWVKISQTQRFVRKSLGDGKVMYYIKDANTGDLELNVLVTTWSGGTKNGVPPTDLIGEWGLKPFHTPGVV